MSRLAKILCVSVAAVALPALTAACGTQNLQVARAQKPQYRGAEIFQERCSGCHSIAAAAAEGSASNVRTAMAISGPNFNQRCERPVTRVLYAIENGGFSGAYMPQNIVVGQDAVDVARFVASYAGRQAPQQSGVLSCAQRSVGALPPVTGASSGTSASALASSKSGSGSLSSSSGPSAGPGGTPSAGPGGSSSGGSAAKAKRHHPAKPGPGAKPAGGAKRGRGAKPGRPAKKKP